MPGLLGNLYQYRRYIARNAASGLRRRYAGSWLGGLWLVLLPSVQLAIYVVIFSRIMNPGLAQAVGTRHAFLLYLCSGLLPWTAFARSVIAGSHAFRTNAPYMAKLPVPEEVYVAQSVGEELLNLAVYMLLLTAVGVAFGHPPGAAFLLAPALCALVALLAFGIGLTLAPLLVFFRDLGFLLDVGIGLWMWTLPIVYVEDILPASVRALLVWNPPYAFVVAFRDVFLFDRVPEPGTWLAMLGWASAFLAAGTFVLGRARADLRDAV